MIRKFIKPGTRLAIRLSTRERDLVVERAALDPEIEAELRQAVPTGSKLVVNLNLDDLDDLLGCVAAEANHCDDGKVRRALDAVCDRLSNLLDQYTDEPSSKPVATGRPEPRFTAKQVSIWRSFTTTRRSIGCLQRRRTFAGTSKCPRRLCTR